MANPSSTYKFNNMQDIKSHSSVLFNERMAILFYLLDMKNLVMHKTGSVDSIYDVHSVLRQLYKNMRMLLRFNDAIRVTMNLETKDRGIYTIDIAFGLLDKMLKFCEKEGFTQKRVYIIIQELDNTEMLLKDILQYFSYFIRPEFKQKPDIDMATEKYKEIADERTVEELRALVGKKHSIDFESLGSERVEISGEDIDYDPSLDGDISDEQLDSEDILIEDEDSVGA